MHRGSNAFALPLCCRLKLLDVTQGLVWMSLEVHIPNYPRNFVRHFARFARSEPFGAHWLRELALAGPSMNVDVKKPHVLSIHGALVSIIYMALQEDLANSMLHTSLQGGTANSNQCKSALVRLRGTLINPCCDWRSIRICGISTHARQL